MAKKVLVVDDEKDITTSIKNLLKDEGYEVETANNGKKALDILKVKKFDLVLLDILMPDISGREVAEKIRADPKLKNQRIAFLTVLRPKESGQDAIKRLNPVEYFLKPIDYADFKIRMKKIVS